MQQEILLEHFNDLIKFVESRGCKCSYFNFLYNHVIIDNTTTWSAYYFISRRIKFQCRESFSHWSWTAGARCLFQMESCYKVDREGYHRIFQQLWEWNKDRHIDFDRAAAILHNVQRKGEQNGRRYCFDQPVGFNIHLFMWNQKIFHNFLGII